MFAHLAVHHPKPEHADDLLAAMHKVDAAAQGAPGLIRIGAWRDERTDRLIGLALWDSKEAFEAAAPSIFAAVAGEPLDEWSTSPPDSLHLHPA
ncbi:antibiotic biosynthesis monooxygenase family protein [Catellatospora vulcania]|uniref:antibiotic biosynthesis monooxygenase family protein n=1 Tax=Catellatospora vulcania TaxID=1460450 RepID=UPI0012D3C640|nr:antibiotic biosynthesis monooxygenase [Catellatospora vulcania]